jgi:LmbE family N-acetylglucosaminyl deacetylase
MKLSSEPLHPKVVLGIAAHPDDLDFGAAGTMARYAQAGAEVHYLIVTDGSKGSSDKSLLPLTLVKMREQEQRKAVKIIGGKSVQFLGFPDAELEVTLELKRQIVKVIRELTPDIVITMDPSMLYSAGRGFINHPDHRAAGQATLDAVFPLARDHLSFPELYANGLEPHNVSTLLLINFDSPNYAVDITRTFSYKMNALEAHASQVGNIEETTKWVNDWATKNGTLAGFDMAETFVRIDIR